MEITHPQSSDAVFSERRDYEEPSVFRPENMLREARRQRRLPPGTVPEICLLDPDGDIVRHLMREGWVARSPSWACYHTELWESTDDTLRIGVVGGAVGASFAVLVAEELFASGCECIISISSAGQIAADLEPPCMILVDRALRGEGTSHAYLPPAPTVDADQDLIGVIDGFLADLNVPTRRGTTWTTDAPFRETRTALATAEAAGAVVVEMEAAALYALAVAHNRSIICFAQVTNTMGVAEGDFEKGPSEGAVQALRVVRATTRGWFQFRQQRDQ